MPQPKRRLRSKPRKLLLRPRTVAHTVETEYARKVREWLKKPEEGLEAGTSTKRDLVSLKKQRIVSHGRRYLQERNGNIMPWFEHNPKAYNKWRIMVGAGLHPETAALRVLNEAMGTNYDSITRLTGLIMAKKT